MDTPTELLCRIEGCQHVRQINWTTCYIVHDHMGSRIFDSKAMQDKLAYWLDRQARPAQYRPIV